MPALVVGLVLTFTRSAWVGVVGGRRHAVPAEGLPAGRRCCRSPLAVLVAVAPADVTEPRLLDVRPERPDQPRPRGDARGRRRRSCATIRSPASAPTWSSTSIRATACRGRCSRSTRICTTCRCRLRPSAACRRWRCGSWFIASRHRAACWRRLRRTRNPALAAGGLAAIVAMLAAGLFEYNFGDSEFLMLFLVLVTLPFAADRDGGLP